MNIKEFFSIVNEKVEKYNLEFVYNDVDGVSVKGNKNYKFVEFDYNIETNQFCFEFKKIIVLNSMQTMKCIQEVSLAGEIIEVLKYLTNFYEGIKN